MLVDADNAAVNHQVFQVRIVGNRFKNVLPYNKQSIYLIDRVPVVFLV